MSYRRGDDILCYSPSFLPFTFVFYLALEVVKAVNRLVFRLRVEGRENLQGVQRAVLVSNHTLLLDPAVVADAIRPRRTYFTMLEETAMFPFFGTFVRLLGAVPIPERPGSVRALERSLSLAFDRLGFVHFFPEGECYRWNQEIKPFRLGAFALADRLAVPVVAVTTVIHERRWLGKSSFVVCGRHLRVPPRVTVVIGRPVWAARFAGPRRHSLVAMSRWVRARMQATIDAAGGSKSLDRGQMPRLSRLIPVYDAPRRTRKQGRGAPAVAGAMERAMGRA